MVTTEPAICVGVDGSPAASVAVEWAAQEATLQHRPLRLVYVLDEPKITAFEHPTRPSLLEDLRDEARRILDEQHRRVRAADPELAVQLELVEGKAAHRLLGESDTAQLMVLGRRGMGGFEGLLLGSVSAQVSAHAACPVLVVPAASAGAPTSVVLGTDGSAGAQLAAEAAFDEASRRALPLVVVLAWGSEPPGIVSDERVDTTALRQALTQPITGLREKFPEVRVEERLVHAVPTAGLLSQVTAKDLLVVGSRGRGGFRGMLLGSVSQDMLHHAPCPLLIVY